jgi:hypothetical protein
MNKSTTKEWLTSALELMTESSGEIYEHMHCDSILGRVAADLKEFAERADEALEEPAQEPKKTPATFMSFMDDNGLLFTGEWADDLKTARAFMPRGYK